MTCPDDFSLEYSWHSGSVPPPYYYEYTVTIAADGRGQVTLLPDYPQHQPPLRRAEFFVPIQVVAQLCERMRAAGLFEHAWKTAEDNTGGGEGASMTVHVEGQLIHVPHLLPMMDGLRVAPVYELIRDLVSEAVERLRGSTSGDIVE